MLRDPSAMALWTKIKAGFERLRAARDGVSAVEFAFIFPIILWTYVGAYEFSQAITIDRRVTAVSSAAADLVAQAENISDEELKQVFTAATSIMSPYDASIIEITITSVVADKDNDTTVDWSRKNGQNTKGDVTVEAGHSKGTPFPLPEELTTAFSSVIVAEVSYLYTPVVVRYLVGGIKLRETFYLRPRRSETVINSDA